MRATSNAIATVLHLFVIERPRSPVETGANDSSDPSGVDIVRPPDTPLSTAYRPYPFLLPRPSAEITQKLGRDV